MLDNPQYAADCVVRSIMADPTLAPAAPWEIRAGIGVLKCEKGGKIIFESASRPRFRLGDAVHAVAHPVAKAVDKIAGTKLANCSACEARRQRLNRL